MNETGLKKKIREYAKTVERLALWASPSSLYGSSGIADFTGVYNGYAIFVECKAPGKYKDPFEGLTPNQVRFAGKVSEAGGFFICLDSLEEFQGFLRGLE
jgi:penicillin-binding protein-related factor A (putative recombinase)